MIQFLFNNLTVVIPYDNVHASSCYLHGIGAGNALKFKVYLINSSVLAVIRFDTSQFFLFFISLICSDRILTFGIRSICSPVKVGIGCYKAVNYQPGS